MAKKHYWPLDESGAPFVDVIGGTNSVAVSGTSSVPGIFGNARKATATTDYISFGDTASDLRLSTGPFSFRVLLTVVGTSTDFRNIFTRDDFSVNKRCYRLAVTPSSDSRPNTLVFRTSVSGTSLDFQFYLPAPINDGTEHDCIITRNGSTIKMYVDGVLVSSHLSFPDIYAPTGVNFEILNYMAHNAGAVDISVDQVEMWDEELTAEYISGLYYTELVNPLVIVDQNPAPNSVYNPIDTPIYLAVESATTNINLSTIDIWINLQLAFSAGGFVSPFTGTQGGDSSKYTFDITSPDNFDNLSVVGMKVYVEDDEFNILQEHYNFIIKPMLRSSPSRRLAVDSDTLRMYRLDELTAIDAVDVSDIHSDGVVTGTSVVTVSDEPFAVMRHFTRANSDVVTCVTAEPANYLSIDATIKVIDISEDQAIVYRFNSSTSLGYYLKIDALGNLVFGVASYELAFDYTEFFGSIHRVCAIYDQVNLWICLDGFAVARLVVDGGAISYDTASLYIGGWPDNLADPKHCDGDIAEVRISSVPRNPLEIFNSVAAVTDPQAGLPVDAGVFAAYNFNNVLEGAVVYDDTGNHNGATVGTVSLVPGPLSAAYREVNSSGYITIPSHIDFNNVKASIVIEAWFTPTGASSVTRRLITKNYGSDPSPFKIRINSNNTVRVNMVDSLSRGIIVDTSNAVIQNKLNFLSVSFNGFTRRFNVYLNNVLTISDAATALDLDSILLDTNPILIGGVAESFDGKIHCVRFGRGFRTFRKIDTITNGSRAVL